MNEERNLAVFRKIVRTLASGSLLTTYHSLIITDLFVSPNLDQMIVGIVKVKSGRGTSGANLVSRTRVIADRVVRVAVKNSFLLNAFKCFVELCAGKSEGIMIISFRFPMAPTVA